MTDTASTAYRNDEHLPLPLRWLTRVMGSWRFVIALTGLIALYLLAAYVPVGGRYLWQQPLIDTTQVQMIRWVPLHVAMVLLAVAVLWATLRSVAWRLSSVWAVVAAIGGAVMLIAWSISLRFGAAGLIVLSPSTPDGLALTTTYADPVERVLVFQFGSNPPTTLPLHNLPRWRNNPPSADSSQATRGQPLHVNTPLGEQLGFRGQVYLAGYLASAALTTDGATGQQSAVPVPIERESLDAGLPLRSLLALRFETEDEGGQLRSTLIWLAFEPDGLDRLMPTGRYNIAGLGSIGLAYRPRAHDLPFAIAARSADVDTTLHIAETNPATSRLMPVVESPALAASQEWSFDPIDAPPAMDTINLSPLGQFETSDGETRQLVRLLSEPARAALSAGGITLIAGLLLWRIGVVIARVKNPLRKQSAQ